MPEKVTLNVLAERISNWHEEDRADFREIKESLKEMNGTQRTQDTRLTKVEVRQGFVLKIVLGSIGGGGALGGIGVLLAKLLT